MGEGSSSIAIYLFMSCPESALRSRPGLQEPESADLTHHQGFFPSFHGGSGWALQGSFTGWALQAVPEAAPEGTPETRGVFVPILLPFGLLG